VVDEFLADILQNTSLTYIAAAIIQNIFGTGADQATIVNLLFSAILLGSVYGLGVQLFSVEVGLWAAGLCQIYLVFINPA
jgi:4-amino-4-deoxy-L-arabinose transferase-like glycosyltransferase